MNITITERATDASMRSIFRALQELLEIAAPSMREESPELYAHAMQMVATGRASFGAKVSTSPGQVTLTLDHPEGETSLVSYMYQEPTQ